MLLRRLLLSPDGDGGSGGGSDKTGDDKDKSITIDQVNEAINKAFGQRDKRIVKNVIDTLTGDESPIMKSIGELGETVKAIGDSTKKTKTKDNDADSDLSDEIKEQMAELQKKNDKMQKTLDQREKEIQQRDQESITKQRKELVTRSLEEKGFKKRAPAVRDHHWNQIKWEAENGEVGKPIVDHDGNEIPYDKWLADIYAKSEEGGLYVDTPSRSGSGAGGGDGSGTSTPAAFDRDPNKMSKKEVDEMTNNILTTGVGV